MTIFLFYSCIVGYGVISFYSFAGASLKKAGFIVLIVIIALALWTKISRSLLRQLITEGNRK